MTRIAVLSLLLLAGILRADAQQPAVCGTWSDTPASSSFPAVAASETGGRYITAHGTLRVLLVFASFPDDERPHPSWPAHQAPLFMQDFIDADTTRHSAGTFNLTNYFSQMSLGQFHLVGDPIWVEAAHPESTYANGSYARANINILLERVDPIVDFTRYDNWTQKQDYSSENVPDGQVDMVIMVWRTQVFPFTGEASLGYRPSIEVDGKRIETGYPGSAQYPNGSGITCEYLFKDSPVLLMRTVAHELGHWLLGVGHPYNDFTLYGKHDYWGMICNGNRLFSCANAYEREQLGWILVPEPPSNGEIVLSDFVTTGAACKYHPANGDPEEYFYLENHQRLSVFDDVTLNPLDKGVWILQQQGAYLGLDNLRIKPSDGNWVWETPGLGTSPPGQAPVFVRGAPAAGTGASHRDMLTTPVSAVEWMRAWQDPLGQVHHGSFYAGELFPGAFTDTSVAVFSPYSNPSSCTWDFQTTGLALELVGRTNGSYTVRFASDPLTLSPARRFLTSNPLLSPEPVGHVSLAWGAEWADGQLLEPDVDWSELERKTGAEWLSIYQGNGTSFKEPFPDSTGAIVALYRVRVRDSQGKYSTWSEPFTALQNNPDAVAIRDLVPFPQAATLQANYPNPFNPSTTIPFSIPASSHVRLQVLDMLGRIVNILLDADLPAGEHRVTWDGTDHQGKPAASGLYIAYLISGNSALSRSMIMIR